MKYVRILCAVALVFALCSAFTMKDKEKAVYAFGVAASFNDSIVYYTDIQVLDSVELDKNGFLPKRDLYTYQLKNYLEYNLKKPDYFESPSYLCKDNSHENTPTLLVTILNPMIYHYTSDYIVFLI